MTTDTFDVWLDELKTIHSREDDHCRADRRSWPCNMRRLIDRAEAFDRAAAPLRAFRNVGKPR